MEATSSLMIIGLISPSLEELLLFCSRGLLVTTCHSCSRPP